MVQTSTLTTNLKQKSKYDRQYDCVCVAVCVVVTISLCLFSSSLFFPSLSLFLFLTLFLYLSLPHCFPYCHSLRTLSTLFSMTAFLFSSSPLLPLRNLLDDSLPFIQLFDNLHLFYSDAPQLRNYENVRTHAEILPVIHDGTLEIYWTGY